VNKLVSDDGRFETNIQGDGNLVTYDLATGKVVWDSMSGHWRGVDDVPWVPPDPPKPPIPPIPPRPTISQALRPYGARSCQDQDGPRLLVGFTAFHFVWSWKFDRDRVKRDIDLAVVHGYDYGRGLCQVGTTTDGYWNEKAVLTSWPDLDELVASLTDYAADNGLRMAWTLMGKGGEIDQSQAARIRFCERMGHVLKGRRIAFAEAMNEAYAFVAQDIIDCRAAFLSTYGTDLADLVGTSAVPGPESGESFGQAVARWSRGLVFGHLDRDQSKSEMQDRPWRQSWEWGLEGKRWVDGEPIGPGSSVAQERRPDVLRSHRLVSFVARAMASCFHSRAGVRGDLAYQDMPGFAEAPRAKRFLPGHFADGEQVNGHWPNSIWQPLSKDQIRADNGNTSGLIRLYSNFAPDGLVYSVPFGLVSPVTLTAKVNLKSVRICNQDTNEVLNEVSLAAGQPLTLPVATDYLLVCERG
jgi:hypothetical protein